MYDSSYTNAGDEHTQMCFAWFLMLADLVQPACWVGPNPLY